MHVAFTDVSSYPESDTVAYFDEGHSLSPTQFGQVQRLDFARKSILAILSDVNEILTADWLPFNFTKTLVNKRLYYDLKEVRMKKEAFSGYYLAKNHLITHVSVSFGRLLQLGIYSFKLLRHYEVSAKDWIVLIQKWNSDYTALVDSVLVISNVPEPSALDIYQHIGHGKISVLTPFEADADLQAMLSIAKPTNLTESYEFIIRTMSKPITYWRNAPKVTATKPEFCDGCKVLYSSKLYNKMKPVPCKNKQCQLAHFDCSGKQLKDELMKAPKVADLLISLTYAAAASPNRAYTLNPAPIGIGMCGN